MSVISTEYMATKNIEINIKTESGYDILYPLTTPQQAGSLPISGGTLTGPLMLNREPQESMEAVNKSYIDNIVNDYILEPDGHINLRENWYYVGKMENNGVANSDNTKIFNLLEEYVNKQIAFVISCKIENTGDYDSSAFFTIEDYEEKYSLNFTLYNSYPGFSSTIENKVIIMNTGIYLDQINKSQFYNYLIFNEELGNHSIQAQSPLNNKSYFLLKYKVYLNTSGTYVISNLYIDVYTR